MNLPKITMRQKEILDLLYKHRFLNRIQIQALLGHKDYKNVNLWLKDLREKQYVEWIYSTHFAEKTKPPKEPDEMAAQAFGVDIREIRLIAAHAWDIAGALRTGCKAAFVARPGMVLDPLADKPDVIGKDLKEVVDRILANERAGL